jgi:hypothetical protein
MVRTEIGTNDTLHQNVAGVLQVGQRFQRQDPTANSFPTAPSRRGELLHGTHSRLRLRDRSLRSRASADSRTLRIRRAVRTMRLLEWYR